MPLPAHQLPPAALSALTEAAAAINSTLDFSVVLQTIARLACNVTHAEASSVLMLDPAHGRLVVLAGAGARSEAIIGRELMVGSGIVGHVVRTGEPVVTVDARSHPRFCREIDDIGALRTSSLLAVPMIQRGEVLGVIEVVNRLDESDFSDHDLKILQIFATLAAGAAQNARAHEDLKRRLEALQSSLSRGTDFLGRCASFRRVIDLCDRVAPTNATVLILGETGTGKELCARYIHEASRRRGEAFVAVNSAALPESLLESELFGHEKGGFTGAYSQRKGWFELADRGTLFLDEIGDISRNMQARLLRVIQEREFVRVGGTSAIPCDVRIIAATNRNLKNLVADGLFREDLYYRLNVFPISLPPLRDRREDVPLLVEHFVRRAAREFKVGSVTVPPETMDILTRYDWPGNVRELQNVIERAVLICEDQTILPCHLPTDIEAAADSLDEGLPEEDTTTLQGQERALILKVLTETGWNQSRTARILGITRDHLRHRIKKYRLQRPREERATPS